ncbi:uncharacterized protein [Ptychodera flava]|uniref:uncharacterized protein n=1 Tax=Ptychodera flava TaxID=63121 RepID=UPI00396A0339
MADLPADRVQPHQPPFTNVGVDYFGPIEVKIKRSSVKRYGVIFTCLAVRAVHIEVADSLSTDSFINALRRFIARRGPVKMIRSDNGTNFVGARRILQEEIDKWNQQKIQDNLLQDNIEWKFNPPYGSHFGGVWERQIRTVRQLLLSLVKQQQLTDESLRTFLCEVEHTINCRPITKSSDDVKDLDALTPSMLLNMKGAALSPGPFERNDMYAVHRWKQVQYLSDLFWKRWIKEYLPSLQERQKWFKVKRNLEVGDVVLVKDENTARNVWPLGRVIKIMPDGKGLVRRVMVKTKNSVLERPYDKLCVLLEAD